MYGTNTFSKVIKLVVLSSPGVSGWWSVCCSLARSGQYGVVCEHVGGDDNLLFLIKQGRYWDTFDELPERQTGRLGSVFLAVCD